MTPGHKATCVCGEPTLGVIHRSDAPCYWPCVSTGVNAPRRLWLRRILHRHRDPAWQQRDVHRYYECRCGAKRVTRAFSNLDGPSDPAWPPLRDLHGQMVMDSGWTPAALTTNSEGKP